MLPIVFVQYEPRDLEIQYNPKNREIQYEPRDLENVILSQTADATTIQLSFPESRSEWQKVI